jgi:hypothetical protein
VKDQSEPQAMHRDPLKHTVELVLLQSAIQMKDKTDDRDLGMLSMYGLDVLTLLVFAAKEMLAVMEFGCHFLPVVLEY